MVWWNRDQGSHRIYPSLLPHFTIKHRLGTLPRLYPADWTISRITWLDPMPLWRSTTKSTRYLIIMPMRSVSFGTWSKWRESNPHPQSGSLMYSPLYDTCTILRTYWRRLRVCNLSFMISLDAYITVSSILTGCPESNWIVSSTSTSWYIGNSPHPMN